jgi:hypothetical protein
MFGVARWLRGVLLQEAGMYISPGSWSKKMRLRMGTYIDASAKMLRARKSGTRFEA